MGSDLGDDRSHGAVSGCCALHPEDERPARIPTSYLVFFDDGVSWVELSARDHHRRVTWNLSVGEGRKNGAASQLFNSSAAGKLNASPFYAYELMLARAIQWIDGYGQQERIPGPYGRIAGFDRLNPYTRRQGGLGGRAEYHHVEFVKLRPKFSTADA